MFSNPLSSATLVSVLHDIVYGIMYIGTPIVALYLIWSGLLFVSARGDAAKISYAKKVFVRGLVAVVLLLGAWTLILTLGKTILGLGSIATVCALGVLYIYFVLK